MKRALSVLAAAIVAAAVPAHAEELSVSFTGTVSQTIGSTGESVGSTVTGHFDLDSVTGNFADFSIAGQSVASGFSSSASIGPALTNAIYTAQVSPVSTGMSTNSTFSLDLSSLTTWPSSVTPYTLLTDTTQLTTNLDTVNNPLSAFPSTFTYYIANADGTNVTSLVANLTSVSATSTVPEPATITLLGASLVGLGLFVRFRRA